MATRRVIIEIGSGSGRYTLGDHGNLDFILGSIEHRRDGVSGLYKPEGDESFYLVEYRSENEPREGYAVVIPTRTVSNIKFKLVEIEEEAPPQPRRAE
jgi:hypothetical protein